MKYVERQFINRSRIPVLSDVVKDGTLSELLQCVALGLDLNEQNCAPLLAAARVTFPKGVKCSGVCSLRM